MTKLVKHPLEDVFDMEHGSTHSHEEYSMIEQQPSAAVPAAIQAEKDAEDEKIDEKIDAVYDAALAAFENQTAYTEIIEPRYAARNAEVAATYLNIALAAVTSRAKVKSDRRRSAQPAQEGGRTTNNIVIGNREEILRMITIDEEKKQIE